MWGGGLEVLLPSLLQPMAPSQYILTNILWATNQRPFALTVLYLTMCHPWKALQILTGDCGFLWPLGDTSLGMNGREAASSNCISSWNVRKVMSEWAVKGQLESIGLHLLYRPITSGKFIGTGLRIFGLLSGCVSYYDMCATIPNCCENDITA